MRTRVRAAGTHPVDVLLHYSRRYHGRRAEEETNRHTLDRGKGEAQLAEGGVDDMVKDGNHDDDRDGVEVLDNVVRDTVALQGRGLRSQVSGHLVIGQVEQRQEEEDLAGHKSTTDFINPGIVIGHPNRAVGHGNIRGPDDVPGKAAPAQPLALHGIDEHPHELRQDGACGRGEPVGLATEEQDHRRNAEQNGGEQEREPEADELLDVDHGDLPTNGPNVDGEVEVQEDASVGDRGVNNNTLAALQLDDTHPGVPVLLC